MRASRADDGQRAAVSVSRHLEGGADVRGSGAPVRARRPQHQEPGERGPLRPVLAAELPRGPPGVRQRGRGVAVEQRGLGEDQPGLGQLHVAAAARVLRDGLLRRLARLADQPHREQELGPVDQQLAQAAVLLADAPLRGIGVGERGRGLPAQAEHERQVGLREPHLQRQRLLPREPFRQAQVRLRRGELVPEGVGEPAVPDHPADPERVAGRAQHRQRLAVVVQRLAVAAQVEQHPAALGQRAGPAARVVERVQHPVELVEGVLRAPALGEQERDGEPGRGGGRGVAGLLGAAEAALQVGQRAVQVAAVPQGLSPGPLRDGPGDRVTPPAGPAHRRGRERHGLGGRGVGQPQRLAGGVQARRSVHASIPVLGRAPCQRGSRRNLGRARICRYARRSTSQAGLCGDPATRRWGQWQVGRGKTTRRTRSSSPRTTWISSVVSWGPARSSRRCRTRGWGSRS